jgi:hypothetical protein
MLSMSFFITPKVKFFGGRFDWEIAIECQFTPQCKSSTRRSEINSARVPPGIGGANELHLPRRVNPRCLVEV